MLSQKKKKGTVWVTWIGLFVFLLCGWPWLNSSRTSDFWAIYIRNIPRFVGSHIHKHTCTLINSNNILLLVRTFDGYIRDIVEQIILYILSKYSKPFKRKGSTLIYGIRAFTFINYLISFFFILFFFFFSLNRFQWLNVHPVLPKSNPTFLFSRYCNRKYDA